MLCISYENFLETQTFLTIPLHDFTSLLGVTDDIQNIDSPEFDIVFIWGKHILVGEGPFSPIFLKIGDRLDAQVLLVVVLYDKNKNIFVKNSKLNFYPLYQGSEKRDSPIIWQKMKIIFGVFS